MRLCKKEFFENLRFLEGYMEEDSILLLYLLEKANKWVHTEKIMYFWRECPESVTRAKFNPKKFSFVMVSYIRAKFFEERHLKKLKKTLFKGIYGPMYILLL